MFDITITQTVVFIVATAIFIVGMYVFDIYYTNLTITYPRKSMTKHESYENASRSLSTNDPQEPCSHTHSMQQCQTSKSHGWCMDRQGGGKCVPGFLDGPFDPGVHCANWWFRDMCLSGPLCRRTNVVPQPSLVRNMYHHPAPYYYRNIPWNTGRWCDGNRCYKKPVVLALVK